MLTSSLLTAVSHVFLPSTGVILRNTLHLQSDYWTPSRLSSASVSPTGMILK